MNPLQRSHIPSIFTSLLYMCGFFIFLEWLYPVKQITETNEMGLFIGFTVFCFLISLFQVRWWLSFLLKSAGILFIIHFLFYDQSFFELAWFNNLVKDVMYNWQGLLNQEWYELTAIFRSLLFLILIWLMSYLIYYWFVMVKRVLLFIILTFIYLSVLDTFTVYDATFSIIRVFILSFLTLGLTNFFKEVEKEGIQFIWSKRITRWLIPILSIVLLSTLVGYAAPKFNPKWPDPIPFLQNATGTIGGSGSTIQKVGYGSDDTRLGGSFVQDDQRVFLATAKEEHYWRIETKDVYTGKGWKSNDEGVEKVIDSTESIPLRTFSENVETEKLKATVQMHLDKETALTKLMYPYGVRNVDTMDGVQFGINEDLESVDTYYNDQDVSLEQYTLTYDYPSFNIEELKKDGEDPAEIKERYTQLPDDLPNRVSTLAEEITSPFETRYEQVSAIEKYFGQSGEYKYQIADVPVPEANQDYVDQFLFNSQVGYCDNYSTSMIVMLRTLDIPARWVKGFTSGEQVTTETAKNLIPEDSNVYEVTNTNAHSWVEVYFPDVGWVPFEPTQGFSNPTEFYTEVNSFEDDDTLEAEELEDSKDENEEESLEEDTEDPDSEADEDEEATEQEVGFTLKRWHLGVGAGVLALILVILFMKRYHIQAILLTKKLERERDVASFQTAYHFLLKLLEKKGSGKDPQQTLREYAKNIDSLYSSQSMRLLTKEYEQILYNNKQVTFKNNELPQLWKDLVEKVLS